MNYSSFHRQIFFLLSGLILVGIGLNASIPNASPKFLDSISDNIVSSTDPFTHDANGNLTSGGGRTISHDVENRITSHNTAAAQLAFTYDGVGHHTSRTEDGATEHHVLDQGAALANVLMVTDDAGTPIRYFIWGHGLLAQIEADGTTTRYIHSDELGSTIVVTDANGFVTDEFVYSPYGAVLARTGTTALSYQWLGGVGVYHDGDDLYHMKARYYSTDLKRFLTKDPIGLSGGFNLYGYAAGNPVFFIDPFGLEARRPGGDYLRDVGDFYLGYGDTPADIVNGTIQLFTTNPLDTASDTFTAITNPRQTATAIFNDYATRLETSRGQGSIVSEILITAVTAGTAHIIRGQMILSRAARTGDARSPNPRDTGVHHGPGDLSDDAVVLRGGQSLPNNFSNGSGVVTNPDGTLDGVSVQSANGLTPSELANGIPHGQVGQTTVGNIRSAGGDVIPSPNSRNPSHATLQGISAEDASILTRPTNINPARN